MHNLPERLAERCFPDFRVLFRFLGINLWPQRCGRWCPFWPPTPGKPQTQHLQSLHHHKLPASRSYYPQFTGGDREAERDDRTCLKIKQALSVHTRIRTRVSLVSTLGQLPQPPVSLDHRCFQTVTDLHTRIHVQSHVPCSPSNLALDFSKTISSNANIQSVPKIKWKPMDTSVIDITHRLVSLLINAERNH